MDADAYADADANTNADANADADAWASSIPLTSTSLRQGKNNNNDNNNINCINWLGLLVYAIYYGCFRVGYMTCLCLITILTKTSNPGGNEAKKSALSPTNIAPMAHQWTPGGQQPYGG